MGEVVAQARERYGAGDRASAAHGLDGPAAATLFAMINGITWACGDQARRARRIAEIPVCVGYKIDGKTTTEAPAQASE